MAKKASSSQQKNYVQEKMEKGFTLIEVLVVIALIGVLAAITIIAINPAKNFQDARNTQRRSDVTQILNGMTQYTSEQNKTLADFGTIPLCTATPVHIGSGTGNLNIGTLLVPTYIVSIPMDPLTGSAADTGYTACLAAAGRLTVAAPGAEGGSTITVSR